MKDGMIEAQHHQKDHHHHNQDHHHNHSKDHHDHDHDHHHKEEKEEEKKRGCRPIAFLLGVPFAVCGLCLSLAGGIVWILGSLLSYVCPCLSCCADLANSAMDFIKFPINVFKWFIDKIPC